MREDPFSKQAREGEPEGKERLAFWRTAIGLQAVDGLKTSEYLTQLAARNMEGKLTFSEVDALLKARYENPEFSADHVRDRTDEADRVSARIAALLSERTFHFTFNELLSIHRKLFNGIFSHAGRIRDYNITKSEWVLNGASVRYVSAPQIRITLEYDFSEEEKFSYKNLTLDEKIHHLVRFVSNLWQIHPFGEGNTRTTAVFFLKYLRTLGLTVTGDSFTEHAWYFRNALVRANYSDLRNDIRETTEYLELFMRNLLLNENHVLDNQELQIG